MLLKGREQGRKVTIEILTQAIRARFTALMVPIRIPDPYMYMYTAKNFSGHDLHGPKEKFKRFRKKYKHF